MLATFKADCEEAPLFIRVWQQAAQVRTWFMTLKQKLNQQAAVTEGDAAN